MKHELIVEEFISYMEDPELKELMENAIFKAKAKNPSRKTNPAQTLEEFYDYLDWACKCLPWNAVKDSDFPTLYLNINQSINYFWFIFGQKQPKLMDADYYLPSLEYHEPIRSWIAKFSDAWGEFLSSEESWNDEYYKLQFTDDAFGMNNGWYADSNVWKTYNEFFSRKLKDSSVRPIGNAELVSPADSAPDVVYQISQTGHVEGGATIKDHKVYKVGDILGPLSEYKNTFNGGTLTHTFLDVYDYHRYHFPIDGEIVELSKIKGANAVGGHTYYEPSTDRYCLDCMDTNWQIIETRDVCVLKTKYGYVAIMPIGMSQVCSCNFEDHLEVGMQIKKGDPMGYFLFGGSDIVMLFEKNVDFKMLCTPHKHLLMGENYAELKLK